jgi:DNA-binding response OmpR family regulator
MRPRQVVIVDERWDVAKMLQDALPKDSFTLSLCRSTQDLHSKLQELRPDIFLISRHNSITDGIRTAHYLRTKLRMIQPVILYGNGSNEADMIAGLEAGADDFIPQYSSIGQIVARIQAHLRRTEGFGTAPALVRSRKARGLEIDLSTRSTWLDGQFIALSSKEFDLLYYLIQTAGRVVPLGDLFSLGWGEPAGKDTRTVLVHISNLRKKLRSLSASDCPYIITVRGIGYMFNSRASVTDLSPQWSHRHAATRMRSSV